MSRFNVTIEATDLLTYFTSNDVTRVAEAIALVLTSPTIWLGVGVICLWGSDALRAVKKKRALREAHEWLIVGVAVGFVGAVLDSLYWGLAWTADFNEATWADYLMTSGALPGIVFKQICGIYAAHCHIMAYITMRGEEGLRHVYRTAALISVIFGTLWVCLSFLLS